MAFAGRLVRASGVYLSPVYAGTVAPITLEDAFGAVDVFLLPFLKPASVRRFYPMEDLPTTSAAIACAIAHMPIDPSRRNVLVAHQFVAGGQLCDSEEFAVGDADNVAPEVFAPFDYVALGHLHGAQNAQGERVRYCGSPLKYSFSEARQQKSLTVAELGEKGALRVSTRPLTPRRDLCEIRGTLQEVTSRAFYETVDAQAYMHVVLTDGEDVPGALARPARSLSQPDARFPRYPGGSRTWAVARAGNGGGAVAAGTVRGVLCAAQWRAPVRRAEGHSAKADREHLGG